MSPFVFQWPAALILLLISPALILLLAYARKQRNALIQALGGGYPTHRRLRDHLRVAAFILLVLALARPGYAPQIESVSRSGRDVVFALDVSRSMLAVDARPSRLEVAKQAIRDALDTMGTERVGLIAYAGSASILCPLTYDYDFVRFTLEQANPRTVDFGGTALQSAVEKALDQVFLDGREGVQDLIVLTDGGDHGSVVDKIIETLTAKQVDVLLVGIGDPNQGAPIQITDETGATKPLEVDGETVLTKLEDDALRQFAAAYPAAQYEAVGTRPFHLGERYLDYTADKITATNASDTGIVIYQEAAPALLFPALLLLLLSELWGRRGLRLRTILWLPLACALLSSTNDLQAGNESFQQQYKLASDLYTEANYAEAELAFAELYHSTTADQASPQELATVQFNHGLCLSRLAEAESENPYFALDYAQRAQRAYLSAKRNTAALPRASTRLLETGNMIRKLEQIIAEQEQAQQELDEAMQALVERLKQLLTDQQQLRSQCNASDVPRKRSKGQTEPIVAPPNASNLSTEYSSKQDDLADENRRIQKDMTALDAKLSQPIDGTPPQSILAEPLVLIEEAYKEQNAATANLEQWNSWPSARNHQAAAEKLIEAILKLLEGDSQNDSEASEDWDEYDDYDYDEMSESEESMSSSEQMEGDFAASSEMQALPVPNYSAEEILLEEQGNLQFRQQKRASANAAAVKKDY